MLRMVRITKYLINNLLDYNWQLKQSLSVRKETAVNLDTGCVEQISPVLRLPNSLYICNITLAYLISFFILLPFLAKPINSLLLALPLSLIIFKLINHYFSLQKLNLNEQAFLAFLQELIAILHNGTSFENAILHISAKLCKFYGENSAFSLILQQVSQALANSWTLRDLQSKFLQLFPNRYAQNYFTILQDQVALTNQLLVISQSFAKNMQAKANMEQEIKASAAQQHMEATILLFMPLAIIYILRFLQNDFFEPALHKNPGPILLTAAFVCLSLSAILLFYLYVQSDNKYKKPQIEHAHPLCKRLVLHYWTLIIQLLPLYYTERLKRNLLICSALSTETEHTHNSLLQNKQALLSEYFAYKLQVMLISLIILLLLSLFNFKILLIAFPLLILIFYLLDLELQSKCQKELLILLELLPWDFSLLIMLLKNNYSLINSFAKLQKLLADDDPLRKKFHYFWQEALLGSPINNVFFNWTDTIANFTFSSYFNSLHAYVNNGDQISLQVLSEQTERLFINALLEHKQAQSKRQTAFVMPMILDLVAVILITIAPVIPSLAY